MKANKAGVRGKYLNIEVAARDLRKNLTQAEAVLWETLRRRKLEGLKFRRQHPIEIFIVDFYCAQARLVIELDGSIHEEQIEQDGVRTDYLESLQYRIIRFPNELVLSALDTVLDQILLATKNSL